MNPVWHIVNIPLRKDSLSTYLVRHTISNGYKYCVDGFGMDIISDDSEIDTSFIR
jgi:hypothetical protein